MSIRNPSFFFNSALNSNPPVRAHPFSGCISGGGRLRYQVFRRASRTAETRISILYRSSPNADRQCRSRTAATVIPSFDAAPYNLSDDTRTHFYQRLQLGLQAEICQESERERPGASDGRADAVDALVVVFRIVG